ncbi:hypothetical protein V3851_25350 [Paenibacillus sp. M1]|uniref:Uncharacterized protein n=1 Tax=Paenibacillus haidiansis TaxID=1574488 RepID=A0ABU7VZB7_9BACL
MLQLVKNQRTHETEVPELPERISALWSVELLYGKHPAFSTSTYCVKLTTKLEGNASKCYLVIDLRDRFEEFLRELNIFGVMEKADFHKVIDYVTQLKIKGVFRRVANLLDVIEGTAENSEGYELFDVVSEAIINDLDSYPTISSDQYKHGSSAGVILDTEQYITKYGENAVGITTEALIEILELESSSTRNVRLTEITRSWKELGLLLKLSKQSRLQEPVKPWISSKDVKRFYILKIDAIAQE